MLGFQIKDTFEQKVTDILLVLVIIHVGSVMFLVLIRWIHPYVKTCAAMYGSSKLDSVESVAIIPRTSINACKNKNRRPIVEENGSNSSSDDEFLTMIESLKSLIDVNYSPTEELLNNFGRNENLSNDKIFGIDNAGEGILNKMKYSNEAQTNITINPKLQLDLSFPNLIYNHMPSEILIENSASSESFVTAVSQMTLSDFESDAPTVYCPLGCYSREPTQISKVIDNVADKLSPMNIHINKSGTNSLNEDYGIHITQKNKLLEMAIIDFEKELRPIQDQIKVLKQCLREYENCCNTNCCPSSDFSSSVSETLWESECFSGVLSSTCSSSSTFKQVSSHQTLIRKQPSCYKRVTQSNKRVSELSLSTRKTESDKYFKSSVVNIDSKQAIVSFKPDEFTKRSPLAEMYVALAQSNSQSSYYCNMKEQLPPYNRNGSTVTCHINVNVKVGTLSVMNVPSSSWPREQTLIPVLSDPDDILGSRSINLVSLKQVINPTNYCHL